MPSCGKPSILCKYSYFSLLRLRVCRSHENDIILPLSCTVQKNVGCRVQQNVHYLLRSVAIGTCVQIIKVWQEFGCEHFRGAFSFVDIPAAGTSHCSLETLAFLWQPACSSLCLQQRLQGNTGLLFLRHVKGCPLKWLPAQSFPRQGFPCTGHTCCSAGTINSHIRDYYNLWGQGLEIRVRDVNIKSAITVLLLNVSLRRPDVFWW